MKQQSNYEHTTTVEGTANVQRVHGGRKQGARKAPSYRSTTSRVLSLRAHKPIAPNQVKTFSTYLVYPRYHAPYRQHQV